MRRPKLSPTAREILRYLRQHASVDGAIEVSRTKLARHVGKSDNWTRQAIKSLEGAGLIEVEHCVGLSGQMLTNSYRLTEG
jgi:DNA-binding Lrp family transcriptional regulator